MLTDCFNKTLLTCGDSHHNDIMVHMPSPVTNIDYCAYVCVLGLHIHDAGLSCFVL